MNRNSLMSYSIAPVTVAALVMFAQSASGQTVPVVPDAGQSLQQLRPQPALPAPDAPVQIRPDASARAPAGGPQVVIQSVRLSGNTVYDDAVLAPLVADGLGRSLDLAGLQALAQRITDHYRAHGYPFARALIPAQDVADGILRIAILEGRYGRVQATSAQASDAQAAQAFLAPLQPGQVIAAPALERSTLLLGDLPGVRVSPVMRPGSEVGAGDLEAVVEVDRGISGRIGFDNHGNRYTGRERGHLSLSRRSLVQLGDALDLSLLGTSESLWLGNIGYSLPLGGSGWSANAGWALARYTLGKEFADADASGTARVLSAGVSHATLRSQRTNLRLSGTYQHKSLKDERGAQREDKSSDSVLLLAQLDHRDALAGGVSVLQAGWTAGRLDVPVAQRAMDVNRTHGGFNKLQLDALRLQPLPQGFELFGRLGVQWSEKNLDSSEKLGIGGVGSVRAYPSGEASGDQGWLAQLELRRSFGAATPYVFYDYASVRLNADPQPGDNGNKLRRAGAGAGVRFSQGGWDLDVALAWQTQGGAPRSEPQSTGRTRGWVNLSYAF